MSDGPNKGQASDGPAQAVTASNRPGVPRTVEAFASQVLTLVASNSQVAKGVLRQDLLEDLIDAVQAFDDAPRVDLLSRFATAGITPAQIVDRYLPPAARDLGDAWCADQMSFADVTIGSARLQAMLRDLRAPQVSGAAAPSVLVVVPEDAYHTLGASVVADQLRRLGVATQMSLGLGHFELRELVESHEFNAVMISAASSERLETLRELVNCIRAAARSTLPIILGGTITEKDTDVKTLTGADHVSNNPEEALRACGLTIPTHAAAPQERRG